MNTAAFTMVAMKEVNTVGAPSYTSGVQKWKGAADTLNAMLMNSSIKPEVYQTSLPALEICKAFTDDSALVRHELSYVLGQMQLAAAVPTLTRILDTPTEHSMVRHESAEALGAIASRDSIPILQRYAADLTDAQEVRESCVVALDILDHNESGAFQYADGLSTVATTTTTN